MIQADVEIVENIAVKGAYKKLILYSPEICKNIQPGQFIQLSVPDVSNRLLRHPFSIYDTDGKNTLSIFYKIVGSGTQHLAMLSTGKLNILGPLGNGFSIFPSKRIPILVAGGYGAAALWLLAKNVLREGIVMLGAKTDEDIILADEFIKLGFDVKIATEDGSAGERGVVTLLLDKFLKNVDFSDYKIYGCGPTGMLNTVAKSVQRLEDIEGELSFESFMACGVGACYGCVIKIKADNEKGWKYVRVCREGPVFNAREIFV